MRRLNSTLSKTLLLTALGSTIAPNVLGSTPKKSKKPMNIIYIMSDDHTSQAIGVYGSRLAKLNPTPVIDSLASEGIIFDNCFCNNSISTPSRATIMTGQYSHVNGSLTLDEHIKTNQQYLTQEMHKLGYQTAMVGKWHLGCEPTEFDYYNIFSTVHQQGTYFDPILACSEIKDMSFPDNSEMHKGYSQM